MIQKSNESFLSGGGEMGELIRAFDWHNTALGSPTNWPQSLKTSIRVMLSSGHPMFIWWGPELIQFYNDAYKRSIGLARHLSALGMPGRDSWSEMWELVAPQIDRVMSGDGATWHANQLIPITRRNGRRVAVYWTYSYSPIDEPNSPTGVGGVLVICTETTAQVLEERRKNAAELRWRELFNQSPGFMCILSGSQHQFEFANPRYFELLGGRELINKTVREAIPEAESQGYLALLDEAFRTGKAISGVATPLTLARLGSNVHYLYIDFVYQPIFDQKGEVTGIFVNGYDVTDRVHAKEILVESDRRKDVFLAMLSHELRNPLAPLSNAAEILVQTSIPGSSPRALGELITRQVTQLTHLVDDLLDVSRITHGKIELRREPLQLNKLIQHAIEAVQPLLTKKSQKLIYSADTQGLFVNGDLTRLIQCLSNVLVNASKYSNPGEAIQIQLRRVDQIAVIEITDNGIGISAEMLPNVFELFIQSERTSDRTQGGLGVGLSIVRRLIQMHGGHVSAMSEGLGRGARFEICIPLAGIPQTKAAVNTDLKVSPMRILIIDDNVDSADSLASLLRLKGHHTLCRYNAKEALIVVKNFAADIVLLDIGLPDMDGHEVARRLRTAGHIFKLVALTGYGKPDDIQRALEAGFDAHITKPVIFTKLEQLLNDIANFIGDAATAHTENKPMR